MVKPTDQTDSNATDADGQIPAQADPDGDPGNLNPRDTLDEEPYEGDPDADPGNLNPRDTLSEEPYDGDSGNLNPRSAGA